MKVKTQANLHPVETKAHSVVVYDDNGNAIFAATHILDQAIVAARVGESDFAHVLKLIGDDLCPKVTESTPPQRT
jgi:hypothetical protein